MAGEAVKLLLQHGACADPLDAGVIHPIHLALLSENLGAVKELLQVSKSLEIIEQFNFLGDGILFQIVENLIFIETAANDNRKTVTKKMKNGEEKPHDLTENETWKRNCETLTSSTIALILWLKEWANLRTTIENSYFVPSIASDIFELPHYLYDVFIVKHTYAKTSKEEPGTPWYESKESLKKLRGGFEGIEMLVWRIKMKFRDFVEAERRRLVKSDFSNSVSDEFDGNQLEPEPVNLQSPAP